MSNVIIRGKSGATVPPRKFRWVQSGSGAAQLTITLVAAQLPTNTSDDGPTHIKYIEEMLCLSYMAGRHLGKQCNLEVAKGLSP